MAATEPTLDDLARLHAAAQRAGFEILERDRLDDPGQWAEETRFALRVIGDFADQPWHHQTPALRLRLDSYAGSVCARMVDRVGPQFAARLAAAWHLADPAFAERVHAEQAVLENDRLDELTGCYVAVALYWLVREWYWPTTTEGNDDPPPSGGEEVNKQFDLNIEQ